MMAPSAIVIRVTASSIGSPLPVGLERAPAGVDVGLRRRLWWWRRRRRRRVAGVGIERVAWVLVLVTEGVGVHVLYYMNMAPARLVTLPGVELMKTGRFNLHKGGDHEFTAADIAAAVDAHNKGILRKPTIRLGHDDARFTGSPSVGFVDNLRASAGGNTLLGDLCGMPEWLADILASAYPSRSIEALYDYIDPRGEQHDFVMTGLALLGVTPPGIDNLASISDVARLYDIAATAGIEIGGRPVEILIHASPAG